MWFDFVLMINIPKNMKSGFFPSSEKLSRVYEILVRLCENLKDTMLNRRIWQSIQREWFSGAMFIYMSQDVEQWEDSLSFNSLYTFTPSNQTHSEIIHYLIEIHSTFTIGRKNVNAFLCNYLQINLIIFNLCALRKAFLMASYFHVVNYCNVK